MGQVLQRNAATFSTPQAAPISLGQYGMPQFSMSQFNTAGGLPIPDLGQGPSLPGMEPPKPRQNFMAPHELTAMGFGKMPFGGNSFNPFSRSSMGR